jgi:Glyoxalase-like domain
MATYVKSLTLDCQDALVVARFWAAALGGEVDEDATSEKAFMEAPGWGGPSLWFQRVPESKQGKLRLHFDLRAPAGDVQAEVKRLTGLGATFAWEVNGLTVLRDPEGNEFCVEE